MFRVHISIRYCHTEKGERASERQSPLEITIVRNRDGSAIWGSDEEEEKRERNSEQASKQARERTEKRRV